MNNTSVVDILDAVLWLMRDIAMPLALFLAFLGLFSERHWLNAVIVWVLALLGTVAMLVGDFEESLLNLSDELVFLCLLAAALLIALGFRRNRSGKTRRGGKSAPKSYTYEKRDGLLTPTELVFYRDLVEVVGPRATICPKVNLWDIFTVPDRQNSGARARISQKHVDFLLCNPTTMEPIVGIELDDSSHNRPARQERDQFVDQVYSEAGLPLVHIRAQRRYNTDQLVKTLVPYLGNGNTDSKPPGQAPSAATQIAPEEIPQCPKCGAPMVIRTATKGKHQGQQFYTCTHYPTCRGGLPVK